MGQIIKEMRDVEQRLGKPDTGEDTQGKQKQIVKQLETLIEQMRQSGCSRGNGHADGPAGRPEAGRSARPDSPAPTPAAPRSRSRPSPPTSTRWPAARTSGATFPPSSGRRWRTSSRKSPCPPRRT